ncbi:MAG: T9SS type A sorting domain-containing protein [Flavobacteriales bacterium]|nr:T9SS type A sorting domain-containing protein [Flavobacteriales bacterium]
MKQNYSIQFALFSLLIVSIQFCFAQPGTNDISFNIIDQCGINSTGAFGLVYTQDIQQDGKIIIGGDFSSFNGLDVNRLVRINANGDVDQTFNIGSGFNAIVYSVIILPNGKILVGGDFTSFNGLTVNRIVRLNSNGSIDPTFQSSADGAVRCISIQSNKILIGGDFWSINNGPNGSIRCIARLNMDGSTDNSFDITTGFPNGSVNVIKQQYDGKIIIGGTFTLVTLNSTAYTARRLVRLNVNGGLDTSFNIGASFGFNDGAVNAIDILQDGTIVVGGSFTSNRIAFLSQDGYSNGTTSVGTGFDAVVNEITVQPDNKILIGGNFTQYNGNTNRLKIIRLNSNGTIDNTLATYSGFTGSVNSINVQLDGKILVSGGFSQINGSFVSKNIARLNTDGTLDVSFKRPLGILGRVRVIESQSDGKLIVGGEFSNYNGVLKNSLARLHPNGEVDNSFNTGTGFFTPSQSLSGIIYAISLQQDGKILVGGDFTAYSGTNANRIIRLNSDGSIDNSFNVGSGFPNGSVNVIKQQTDGKILVSGTFTQFNGFTANRIIRLNTDGSVDNSFNIGSGFNNFVSTIVVQSDGKILIGGAFTQFNGLTRNRIIRLNANGSDDATFNIGTGFNNTVSKIGITQAGKIVVAGGFTSYNSVTENSICQLNNNGSLDITFSSGTGLMTGQYLAACQAMYVHPDGKIIVGGNFSTYNGTISKRIVRLNSTGSIDNTFNIGSGFYGLEATINNNSNLDDVLAIHFLNGQYVVGGDFEFYNGFCRDRIARINGNCPSSYTYDSIQSCGSYTWINGLTYNSDIDNVVYTLPNSLGCDSIVILTLNVNDIPLMPNGNNQQSFCSGTLGDLSVVGTQLKWYSTSFGDIALNQTTTLQNNTTYYASQTVNGCESTDRLAVTVTILAPISPSGNSSQTFCNTVTVNSLSATGTGIQWYNVASGGTALAANTALVNGQIYYATQTVNNCESQQRLAVTVILNSPATPTGPTTQNFCNAATVGNLSATGTNVNWYTTATGGNPLITSTALSNGMYYASQTINNCESMNRLAVNVSLSSPPNTNVTLNGNTLTANQQGATYQWLNCDNNLSPITGANQISFTPLVSGNYAVRITKNGCTDTSVCNYVQILTGSIDENDGSLIINLYPNPNSGTFIFETTQTGKYLVMNNLGQIITEFNVDYPSQKEVNLNNPAKGIYYIKHITNQTRPIQLIIN